MAVYRIIDQLISKCLEAGLIDGTDVRYVRNRILALLNLDAFEPAALAATDASIPDLLEELTAYAVEREVIGQLLDEREILAADIMDCFLSKPSAVNETFYSLYEQSPEHATDYFYALSQNSNYIQTKRIRKNIHYKSPTPFGELDITINLSKPEKDPEQIRLEKELKKDVSYPKCLLCAENEGYEGRVGYPARANHRIIHVPLGGENWYLQYSPYVYYNEHSIVLAEEHRDMKVDSGTFERLTAFVDKFPHYFVGSNADLPIVGGSILSHDHYQGGRYEFAMTKAEDEFTFQLDNFPDIAASVVHWPLSVIRLKSDDRKQLVDAAASILGTWRSYNDPDVSIQAFTGDTPHNTITPIARMRNGRFELDLVLRNNRTTDEHPMGLFHPHEDVHHIKKENIGLIEVMGLAVLPPRLKTELETISDFLLGKPVEIADYHKPWVQDIQSRHTAITPENVQALLDDELGQKFLRVLKDAGVFKTDASGRDAFKRFIASLNGTAG